MKRIAALVLCLLLALCGCASPSGTDAGISFRLGDLVAALEEQIQLDLTGFDVRLEMAEQDGAAGMRLVFETEDQVYGQAILSAAGERLALKLDSGDLAPVYALDNAPIADALTGAIHELLFGADAGTDPLPEMKEQLQSLLDQLPQTDPDKTADAIDQLERLFDSCFYPGEPTEIDGVTYETTVIDVEYEQLLELLMLQKDTRQAAQELQDSGSTVALDGELYTAGDAGMLELRALVDSPDIGQILVGLSLDMTEPDVASLALALLSDNEPLGSLSLNCAGQTVAQAPWLAFDTSDAVLLQTQNADSALEQLLSDGASFAGSILYGAQDAMAANMAASPNA